MTHIFVVNEKTFKIHLEYMFAGTGYSTYEPDFIDTSKESISDSIEKTFVGMIADISRVRENDLVAFYVTGCKKIFGFFKIAGEPYFESKSRNYLGGKEELDRYLPFRVKIKPHIVFSEGITEHQALDDIYNVEHPYEMCWSLIYRKLTGMRGCSFVTDYESSRLNLLISLENKNKPLVSNSYSYDSINKRIIAIQDSYTYDRASKTSLDITHRLLNVSNSFEAHLQAYVMQNHDKGALRTLIYPIAPIRSWIGNEVICSVGEQRIDVLTIVETKENYTVKVIELKQTTPYKEIVEIQIRWYIKWVLQYLVPFMDDKEVVIIPTIIANRFKKKSKRKIEFYSSCEDFNVTKTGKRFGAIIKPVEYIAFDRKEKLISFEKIF